MPGQGDLTLSLHGQKPDATHAPVPQPVLFVALECDRLAAGASRHALGAVGQVLLGRGREREVERRAGPGGDELAVRVPDRWMSSQHARIEASFGRWILFDAGSKNGTVVNGTSVDRAVLRDGDLIELGHTLFWYRERVALAADDPIDLHVDLDAVRARPPGLTTLAASLSRSLAELERVARSALPIILFGESGTGKELLARAIHRLSGRKGDLVAVNCGAIPDTLIESELFGHRRGAFSGANEDRPGLIRSADQGTLFLDEIGDLPMASQAALLRVLQEREVVPVGASRPVPVDIRVVAATHRDLGAMVDRGDFRQDLYARLRGYTATLPPLRERREDLGLLVGGLLAREQTGVPLPAIDPAAARALFVYGWPRNVRELASCLGAAAILAADSPIRVDHLSAELREGPRPTGPMPVLAAMRPSDIDSGDDGLGVGGETAPGIEAPLSDEERFLRDKVDEQLRLHGGNVSAVARAMAKDRKQIQRWMKRFQLAPDRYR